MNKDKLKDSVLDDSADIYKPREDMSEREKWSSMNRKEKIDYFNTYYRKKTVIGIIGICFLAYMLYSILSPKPETKLFVAILNGAVNTESTEQLEAGFAEHIQLNEETETLMFDNSFYINREEISEFTMANEQKLSTYIFSGEIDIIIAPEADIENHAKFGALLKVTEFLPPDLVSAFAENLYYQTLDEDKVTSPYGIYLDDRVIYDNTGTIMVKPVLGVVANSSSKETAVDFIRYIFGLN